MRLRHIEIFYHVYKEGSISAAARNLFVSQPSVSKVLRHAEDQLGFDLFDRRKGRLYPTAAADELFRDVEDIYARMSSLNRNAGNIRSRRSAHVRLGALPSLAFSIIPHLVSGMHSANREVSFDLSTLHSEDIEPALIEKRLDFCIGFDTELDNRIRCQAINAVDLVLLAKKGSIASTGGVLSPRVLDQLEIVGLRDSGPVADRIDEYLEQAGVDPVVSVTAQTYYVAAELVKLGVGPAVVDGFTAQRFASADLDVYQLEGAPTLPFAAMYLTEDAENPLVRSCIAQLQVQFG